MQSQLKKAQEIVERCETIPPIPAVLSDALQITADPNVSFDKVAEVVSKDSALSARILRIVNSPYYSLRQNITSLNLALVVLGLREFRCILIASAMMDMMRFRKIEHSDMYLRLWRESLYIASITRELNKEFGLNFEGEDLLVGLLSNVGAQTLLKELSKDYVTILEYTQNNHKQRLEMELDKFGCTHAEVAGALLQRWKLPKLLVDPMFYQYDVEYVSLENSLDLRLSALLRLGRYALIEWQEQIAHTDTIRLAMRLISQDFDSHQDWWDRTKYAKSGMLTRLEFSFVSIM